MENFKTHFNLGKKVERHRNCYKLEIDNSHGDADANTTTITYFTIDEENMLKNMISFLKKNRYDVNKKEYNLLTQMFPKLYGIIERDVYSDGEFLASPTIQSLTFFDENGDEYSVNY